jgi:soluble lytic murein transglycosylase-like protein
VRYPVPRWQPAGGYQLEPTLIHAVIRAESGFDPYARSPKGAVGLMQVMPSTARLAAKAMRIAYRGERWLMHPAVNMTIGQGWLRQLAARKPVDGSLVHLIAAYNAGEGRVAAWAKGPLRHAAKDPLLYIESVPLTETRNYIKRVLANLWAYQARRGGAIPSLVALAENSWPEVEPAGRAAVAAVRRTQRHARAD